MARGGSRIGALAAKEFRHIMRDPRSLWIIFMLPIVMIFLFGYAIDLDVTNVRLALCDRSGTPASRALVRGARSVELLHGRRALRRSRPRRSGSSSAGSSAPPSSSRRISRGGSSARGAPSSGSSSTGATRTRRPSYRTTSRRFSRRGLAGAGRRRGEEPHVSVARRSILYNRTMDSTNFIVPGIAAIVMMMLGALLTSVTIVREKETGTMEQILVSPVRSHEVILGKVLPYLALAFCVAAMIVAVGHFHFRVPFAGSRALLMLYFVLYLFTALSLGLLVSTIVVDAAGGHDGLAHGDAASDDHALGVHFSDRVDAGAAPVRFVRPARDAFSRHHPGDHAQGTRARRSSRRTSPRSRGSALALMAIAMKRFSLKLRKGEGGRRRAAESSISSARSCGRSSGIRT